MVNLLEIAGVLVVIFGLREVFRDIFHPTQSGSLSDFVGRAISLLMRHTRFRPAVGPISLVCVIFSWVMVLCGGFALIYCGLAPKALAASSGSSMATLGQRLFHSMYFSLGAFDTFQTFDLQPTSSTLRLVIAVEGLIGLCMITASVSWLVLLYPALARGRQFAKQVSVILEAEQRTGMSAVKGMCAPMLMELGQSVLQFRMDVILFPILLNFYPADSSTTIGRMLPEIHRFALEALAEPLIDNVRFSAAELQVALEELATILAHRVLDHQFDDIDAIFRAFQKREQ